MKEQDYNNLIFTISNYIAPLNQLLYEILVIITLYIFLEKIQLNLSLSNNATSVIIIFTILALGLDWYVWNNPTQTLVFGAILLIYIRYNFSNFQLISSFVNLTGEYADAAKAELYQPPSESTTRECNTPRIPEMVDLPYDTTEVKPGANGIMAFDKSEASISSIYDAYKSEQPPATITDSKYAQIMLDELYQTPQYLNNHPPNEIDSSLANDIHQTQIPRKTALTDEELLDSFRHPKKQFLDNRWLSMPGIGTYNDNLLCRQNTSKGKQNKDAICSLVQFGKTLEQCTNQDYNVAIDQLDKISNNDVPQDNF